MFNKKDSLKEVLDFLKLLIISILLPTMFSIAIINFEKQGAIANLANAAIWVLAIPLIIVFLIYIICLKKFDDIA